MVGKTKSLRSAAERVENAEEKKARPGRPKSPARRSPGRPKSPSRRKSPARKSPTRKSPVSPVRRSPGRKSPSRATERPVRITRKQLVIESDDSDDLPEVEEVKEKPKAAVRGRTRKLEIELEPLKTDEIKSYIGPVKRVTRSANRELERVVHLKSFNSLGKMLGEFSDEDDLTDLKLQNEKLELVEAKKLTEYCGTAGTALLILVTPLLVLGLNACSQCAFKSLPSLAQYKNYSAWLDLKASLVYSAYLIGLVLLTAFPYGGRRVSGLPNKQGKLEYNTNGVFALAVLSVVIGGLHFKSIQPFQYVLEHSFHLLNAALISGFMLSLYAHVRSFYVPISALNVNAVGRSHLYAYYLGREVSPRLFGIVDLKLLSGRLANIGALIINTAYLLKSVGLLSKPVPAEEFRLNLNPTVLTYYALSTIYLLDGVWTESIQISSHKFHNEGFGFSRSVGASLYPFVYAPIFRYIVQKEVKLNYWILGLITLVFLVGFALYRLSNNQKNLFKKNPYSPSIAHYDTVPTTQGNKLLASGFWGVVRHPNYLGDLLVNISFGLFAHSVPPVLASVAICIGLVYRAVTDNARCKLKYGASWDRYCTKVRHLLIPKIY